MSPRRLLLTSILLSLVLAEFLLRLNPSAENIRTTSSLGTLKPDPELGWVLKPNITTQLNWVGRTITIHTDAAGHRVPLRAAVQQQTYTTDSTIAIAGDSYVFGNEVNAEETFTWLIAARAHERTVNLGVGGYSLSQECLALRRYLATHPRTSQAYLVVYIGNDIEFGVNPVPGSHVDARGSLSRTADSRANRLASFAVRNSRLAFYAHVAWRRIRGASRDSSATSTSAPAPSAGYRSRWIYNVDAFTPTRLDAHRGVIQALRDDAQRLAIPLTVVLMPERDQVYGALPSLPNDRIAAMLAGLRIPTIDLLPMIRARAMTLPPLWHDVVEGHLSPAGNQLVAELISP
ncbi:MAG: hypothetical protein JWO05_3904 [Gemmatimonadetes bacterium]|nr:hypothetical protein [Gemmatimonadota bacterium]